MIKVKKVQLSIDTNKLAKLISEGKICASDFECLNHQSQKALWELCLQVCSNFKNCAQCQHGCKPRYHQTDSQKTDIRAH